MSEVVAVDIGGTHARFAIAEIAEGRVTRLGEPCILKTADHSSLQAAWQAFGASTGRQLPEAAGIAVACPVEGEVLRLTNNPWVIRPAELPRQLGVADFTLVNDYGAVGHAVAQADAEWFRHVCGPERPLPERGVISIVGPGTGLGVAQLFRRVGGYDIIETEGGHIDFAPLDAIEDGILAHLRRRYRRVSAERIASGPGLANIHEALATIERRTVQSRDEKALWKAAMNGEDALAAAALERFFLALGAFTGDVALAQGATGVVMAGGLGLRLADHFERSGFRDRFIAKGRFERRMDDIPVKLITHPEPGLFGAAAAYAEEHRR